MRIVFHGRIAASYQDGLASLLSDPHDIACLPDALTTPRQRQAYEAAEVIISNRLDNTLLPSPTLRLFHAPTGGLDKIDATCIPPSSSYCNCYGHEIPIAEYVLAVLLLRHIPLAKADAALRRNEWPYHSGAPQRGELHGETIGLLGYGHIGRTIASRAKAFGMQVHVANRSTPTSEQIDRTFGLDRLLEFMASADAIICSLPLNPETEGLVDHDAISAMRSNGYIVNVGRGKVIDEQALYAALSAQRIGGAAIDTWYDYPEMEMARKPPSRLPFQTLNNVIMTPHMSGWTTKTRARRVETIAANINAITRGLPLMNIVDRR